MNSPCSAPLASMTSYGKCRLLLALAGSLFIGVVSASANLRQIGTEGGDRAKPITRNSGKAFGVAFASSDTSINLRGYQSAILSGAPGETVTLDLQNFRLADHSAFTLQGSGTATFIVNVTGQFSLSGFSQIALFGGVRWDHVFFNVQGHGNIVSLNGRAILRGALTASQRTVKMQGHSIVYGRVIADRVLLRGAAQIILPPIVSP